MDPRSFAIEAHGSQRYGERPYVYHLDQVAELVASVDPRPELRVLAYLHDVLEDTSVSQADLTGHFGAAVARSVEALSKRKDEPVAAYVARIAEAGDDAVLVKVADRLANMRSSAADRPKLLERYRQEMPVFRGALHRNAHALLWSELDALTVEP
ncbi:MAG: HD domain-containing protein [Myxococcota bacterium]